MKKARRNEPVSKHAPFHAVGSSHLPNEGHNARRNGGPCDDGGAAGGVVVGQRNHGANFNEILSHRQRPYATPP